MKIGICGGTYDPFHRGHLEPVLAARETMEWDRVIYIPAFMQPFKTDRTLAPAYHRFAMVAAATLDHDFAFASSMELERGRVSYTVETLEELRAQYPDDTLDWIIGDDNFEKLHEWKSVARILELANFAVLVRDHHEPPPQFKSRVCEAQKRPAYGAIAFAANPTIEISSTIVREKLREGEPVDGLVPPPVWRYIQHYGLYRKANS
jgi:nicotinate-nucleotide adenylyltransferase